MNTALTNPLHCLTYRLKGQSTAETLIGSMPEINQFIDDMNGQSSIASFNLFLGKLKTQALGPLAPKLLNTEYPFEQLEICKHSDKIAFENYSRIPKDRPQLHTGIAKIAGVKGIFPPLILNTQTACICAQTGITFAVSLPSPMGTGFSLSHPFIHYSNVVECIRGYQRHGKEMTDLEQQVLAGMLITIGKHKGYLSIKKPIVVNTVLSACSSALLIRAISYFYRKSQNNGFYPVLALDGIVDASFPLLQHIKICEGEDTSITVRTLTTAKKTVRARIYTDKNKQQFTQAKADIKSAKVILDGLRKRFSSEVSAAVFENIETQLDGIFFVTETRKKEICQFIWDVFNGDDGAKSIIILLKTIETDAVESDLLTMSMEKEIAEWKEGKNTEQRLSLQELIAQQKGKA